MSDVERRLAELGITLTPGAPQAGLFALAVVVDDLVYVSGHGPTDDENNLLFTGRVGTDLSVDEGYLAARATGIQILRTLRATLGSLDRVDRIVKALAFVNSAPDFYDQPRVVDGFTQLMIDAFGVRGRHARSAIGACVLPRDQPVEIEIICTVR